MNIHGGWRLVAAEKPWFADIVDGFAVSDSTWSDDDADDV